MAEAMEETSTFNGILDITRYSSIIKVKDQLIHNFSHLEHFAFLTYHSVQVDKALQIKAKQVLHNLSNMSDAMIQHLRNCSQLYQQMITISDYDQQFAKQTKYVQEVKRISVKMAAVCKTELENVRELLKLSLFTRGGINIKSIPHTDKSNINQQIKIWRDLKEGFPHKLNSLKSQQTETIKKAKLTLQEEEANNRIKFNALIKPDDDIVQHNVAEAEKIRGAKQKDASYQLQQLKENNEQRLVESIAMIESEFDMMVSDSIEECERSKQSIYQEYTEEIQAHHQQYDEQLTQNEAEYSDEIKHIKKTYKANKRKRFLHIPSRKDKQDKREEKELTEQRKVANNEKALYKRNSKDEEALQTYNEHVETLEKQMEELETEHNRKKKERIADAKKDKSKEQGNIIGMMIKAKSSIAEEFHTTKSISETESIKIEQARKEKEIEDKKAMERYQNKVTKSDKTVAKFISDAHKAERKALASIKALQKEHLFMLITNSSGTESERKYNCLTESVFAITSIEGIVNSVQDFWHGIDSNLEEPIHISTENKTMWERQQFDTSKGVISFRKAFLEEYDTVNNICEAICKDMRFDLKKTFRAFIK